VHICFPVSLHGNQTAYLLYLVDKTFVSPQSCHLLAFRGLTLDLLLNNGVELNTNWQTYCWTMVLNSTQTYCWTMVLNSTQTYCWTMVLNSTQTDKLTAEQWC